MSVSAGDLAFYAGALVVLFLTPGPVWVAMSARALSGGFSAAWPLAVGVALGDLVWPLLAVFGLTWVLSVYADLMTALRWVAAAIFVVMGWGLIRHAGRTIGADSALTRPGRAAGFAAGVAAILGNPKAILFYLGVLPGFFDLGRVTGADIAAIVALSMAVPMAGNLLFAAAIGRARAALTAPGVLRRINLVSGGLLVAVGIAITLA
ncbi:MAG: LysE family translocator [Rhodobacteraceae bacterium]|nr:LysE family translocator [Paracoccaceae bacterium]